MHMSYFCDLLLLCLDVYKRVFYVLYFFFFFNDTATTEIYTLSLHDALPISSPPQIIGTPMESSTVVKKFRCCRDRRSEEHTSELQSLRHLVCRLLLEKKKKKKIEKQQHDEKKYQKLPLVAQQATGLGRTSQ